MNECFKVGLEVTRRALRAWKADHAILKATFIFT